MRTKAFVGAAPLAVALALASCGGGGGSSSTGADVTAFCAKAQAFQQLQSSFGNLSSLSEAQHAFQQAEQRMQAVDNVAPADLKASADKVLSIFKDVSSAAASASSTRDLQSKLQSVSSELNDLQSPLGDLKNFYNDNCR